MWPLTGGTTCYTGMHNGKGATEWHTLHLTADNTLSSRPITSRDNALVCVGYSATETHECLVLLDLSRFDTPETALDPPLTANNNDRGDWDDQSVSIATVTTTTSTLGTRANSPENVPTQLSTLSFDLLSPPLQPPPITEAVALLMIRSLTDFSVKFTKTLDYRPLSPLLCCFSEDCQGVWLGSSDHNELHLFVCRQSTDWQAYDLSSMTEFQLTSPVMSIKFGPPNCLAVACQDGTIRVIIFSSFDGLAFLNVTQQQVMVDGPIVCLSLRSWDANNQWLVTAGSLCGYAMEWRVDAEQINVSNPAMIAKGFWNGAIAAEDSVMAVCSLDDRVLIGTQSGKVLLYGVDHNTNTENKEKSSKRRFQLLWQCQLPYSIHGLDFLSGNDEKFLVTTRKSIHVFQQGRYNFLNHAASIRSKLMDIIQQEALEADKAIEEPQSGIEQAEETHVSESESPLE
ncbi:hypothetical protein FisN_10Hh020 [Fistulifera solaris]|uniref:Uncharacterized protein n=1 Tax=Fistulifera solaris TaxID=1519565 RepID=A0A1Z5K5S4_FISSO|nr:hypothetical protein FisN_10Hh020 [Fistulifera solaris]|eukprot:GAX21441.1 hypothetical protein FisN_10Hh020 [Fistulifera solaris]